MFPSASIASALTLLLSVSLSSVFAAPFARQAGIQACSGPDGTGNCIPLQSGTAFEDGVCNNISSADFKSLIFSNEDDECISFPSPDCFVGDGVAREFFLGQSELVDGILSLSCN
ncbi:hypothetical protein B0H13DRAFT_2668824 [Mycena leptocephala]|nr:hypothetical protein B0H13DRAFT_2668824 [Mycena leptocephala]